jgi:SagB-type dehydrogenase family enzyme
MRNADTSAAWTYHNGTKHSLQSVNADQHMLEWWSQPHPYKLYEGLDTIPLPQELAHSSMPALAAIAPENTPWGVERPLDLETLAAVLHFSAGITKVLQVPGGSMAFRAAACTGALFHIELYIVCGDLPGLEAGVYHFGVHDKALRRLRSGDFRGFLAAAAGDETSVRDAPASIVFTSTFWRNAWKYRARTYRHSFWDSGTILANMLAVASANGLHARVVQGFVDDDVNRLLGLDIDREVALGLVPLGHGAGTAAGSVPPLKSLGFKTVPPAATEVDYPAIRQIHKASLLLSPSDVKAWRHLSQFGLPAASGELVPLRPLGPGVTPQEPIETVIARRGSTRHFDDSSISFEELSAVISAAIGTLQADFLDPMGGTLTQPYLIVNGVEDLISGAYLFHKEHQALELLRAGDFRQEAGYLDLGQRLAADAAVNVYFLTDLTMVLEQFGNRGYRLAQLEASVMAGRIYLAAYALGLGATGLTFFDDDVTEFFSPHARGKSVMFLIALGNKANRR